MSLFVKLYQYFFVARRIYSEGVAIEGRKDCQSMGWWSLKNG